MRKIQVDGERARSNPSQNQKLRRISVFDDDEDDWLVREEHAAAADDEQDEEEPDDADDEDADADDEPVEEEPHDTNGKDTKGSAKDRSITVSLSDPDVLDCPICFDPFEYFSLCHLFPITVKLPV